MGMKRKLLLSPRLMSIVIVLTVSSPDRADILGSHSYANNLQQDVTQKSILC